MRNEIFSWKILDYFFLNNSWSNLLWFSQRDNWGEILVWMLIGKKKRFSWKINRLKCFFFKWKRFVIDHRTNLHEDFQSMISTLRHIIEKEHLMFTIANKDAFLQRYFNQLPLNDEIEKQIFSFTWKINGILHSSNNQQTRLSQIDGNSSRELIPQTLFNDEKTSQSNNFNSDRKINQFFANFFFDRLYHSHLNLFEKSIEEFSVIRIFSPKKTNRFEQRISFILLSSTKIKLENKENSFPENFTKTSSFHVKSYSIEKK